MTLEPSQLTIALEEKDNWRRTLSVTVPGPLVQQERDAAAAKLAKRLKIPGFRSGRIPASVVEKRYGPALNREVIDRVVGEAYREALKSEALHPISEGELDSIDYEPESDLSFSISFDIRPEFEIGRVGGFAVQRPPAEVKEEDIDRVLERLRVQNSTWKPEEEGHPEDGDLASVTVLKLVDGEGEGEPQAYDLVIGEGEAIPDVEDAIRTLTPGETRDFTVTFPEDFHNEERRGEKQHLRIALLDRKVRQLPDLDDDFARTLGDFEDLAALREKIGEDLNREVEEKAEMAVRSQLLQNVVDANPFQVPGSMVNRYIEGVLGDTEGADPEAVARAREQVRPEAERAVKRILAIERLAEVHDLRAVEDEIDQRIEEIAEKNGVPAAKIYASFQKSGRLENLEREITEEKVFEFLKGQSEVVPAEQAG